MVHFLFKVLRIQLPFSYSLDYIKFGIVYLEV